MLNTVEDEARTTAIYPFFGTVTWVPEKIILYSVWDEVIVEEKMPLAIVDFTVPVELVTYTETAIVPLEERVPKAVVGITPLGGYSRALSQFR